MSVFGISNGVVNGKRVTLSDTSATTVVDSTGRSGIVITGILLVNHSGGSRTPVIDIYDGTTAFPVRDDVALADQGAEDVKLAGGSLRLRKGDVLRVTGNTGLTVHVSYIDMAVSRQPGS